MGAAKNYDGLVPIFGKIILKRIEYKQTGILYIPESVREKVQEGIAVAVADCKLGLTGERIPLMTKKGQHVLFGKYSGADFKYQDEDLVVILEDDIYCIIPTPSGIDAGVK